MRSLARIGFLMTLWAGALGLSSCVLVRVPVEAAGTVVESSARVAEKTAVTTVEVAGKAAGAVIEGDLPLTKESAWDAF